VRAVDEAATSPGTSMAGTSPLAASLDRTRQRILEAAPVFAMVAAAAFLYAMRRPSSILAPGLFADDGTFFKDAIEHGWSAVLAPYNGQLFLVQRVFASLVAPLPILIQPALYYGIAMVAAVLSCSIALSSRWRFPVPLGARFLCVVALLCIPGIAETYGALSDMHWWLAVGLVLLGMLHDPLSRRLRIAEIVFVALTAASGFSALYGLPSLAVRAFKNRSRHSLALLGVALAGVVAELVYLLQSSRHGDLAGMAHPVTAVLILAKRVPATLALGESNLAFLWPSRDAAVFDWLAVVVLVVALAAVWVRAPRLEMAALLLTLGGGWFLALWAMTSGATIYMLFWLTSAARFFLVPRAVAYVSLVLVRPAGLLSRVAIGVSCVLLATGILSDYHLSPAQADDWAPFAACVEKRVSTCTTVISPGWTLEIESRSR
jgi:hypothetical protein